MKKMFLFAVILGVALGLAPLQLAMAAPPSPPWGADAVPDLYAPNLAGPGGFITSTGGAPASAINPAQGGEAQRIVFDAGFLALTGLGSREGFGSAIEAGALFPTRYGVFGGSLRLVDGGAFDEFFPVKTTFSGNINAAKEVYPHVSVGAGLNFGVGYEWSLSGDLGLFWNMGQVGPLGNFTLGAAMKSMGKSWTPTWFSPMVGLSTDLIRVRGKDGKSDPFSLKAQADLGIPSIIFPELTSLIIKLGLQAEIAQVFKVSLSWPGGSGLNVRELDKWGKDKFNPLPSVGIGFNIVLPSGGERIVGGRLPSDGDLAIDLAYKPLYSGITAVGAGLTWSVGIADKRPPVIILDYPQPLGDVPPKSFSPNNDGKIDYLEFPINITDERYVESWNFDIYDEEGNLVRSYQNKELRPETQGMRNFFSRLFAVKAQVEVPETLNWDGTLNSGGMAPDGMYYFIVSAVDDSGNKAVTESYWAVLDNTPPEIAIAPMNEGDRVFSPGGGGSKNTITFRPTGSVEDAWESGIYNAAGEKVRAFDPEAGNPRPRVWDGRNDAGIIVTDGVYTYRIGATDRAENSADASLSNIIINTVRPTVSIFIADPWFSPNNDGIKDTVIMNLTVPSKEDVVGWSMRIRDNRGTVLRTISGGQPGGVGSVWNADGSSRPPPPPDRFEYDGRNDRSLILEEGQYQAELAVNYLNGYAATALSPNFNVDLTPPKATVASEYAAFSPNHGGVQSEMIFKQEGSRELLWMGDVRRATGVPGERAVRSFRFSGVPPIEQRWDGQGESGTFAADGEYIYELYATDQAGNTGRSNPLRFRLSTVDTPVMITTDLRAFAPAGNSPRTSINLNPRVQVSQGVVSYRLDVLDSRSNVVRTFEGRGMPPTAVSWNGRNTANTPSPEGTYTARLELRYEQGNQPTATSLPFELDNTPPQATASAPYAIFSPGGRRPTLPFNVATQANDEWQAAIVGANGQAVRTWNWKGQAPQIAWDGKDNAGNPAPDATYQFTLQSTDEAGNTGRYAISGLALDARVPRLILTASATAIAPRPNQSGELVRFGIINSLADGVESWNLELKDNRGTVLRRFNSQPAAAGGRVAPPPANIGWNGLSDAGAVREGLYTPTLTVNYLKGDTVTAEAAPILVNVTGPELAFSYRPEYFSPDNDGVEDELFMVLGARSPSPIESWYLEIREPEAPYPVFYRIAGRGSPAEIVRWNGRSNRGELVQAATDYPVRYSATDALGNTSTLESKIGIDVLVIRDGDRLRIQVPSIVFRENAADFNGIPDDRLTNNRRVIRRIAEILNKFRDYRIQVEGHANPVLLTAVEEREELQPLSEARARAVMNMLIEFGVARSRLSYVGMGGTRTVVQHADRDNWWKNRRVEFILIK